MSAEPARRSRRAMRVTAAHDRSRALAVILGVAALLAVGMVADLLAAPEPPPPPEALEQAAATAGSWYCPAVANEGENAVVDIAAVGGDASQVVVDRFGEDGVTADDPITVEPGQTHRLTLDGASATAPVAVRWAGGPTAVTWRVDGQRSAAAPCEPAPAEHWYVNGFTTMLGSQSRLHLFNPYTTDAVVRLIFSDPDGADRLLLADNLLVGAGGTTTVNLNRFKPQIADLGVMVEVLAGRVVAQGELRTDPPGDTAGPSGRLLLPAASQPAMSWAFAWSAHAEGSESWLSVMNPGDQAAAVEVRVTEPREDGGELVGEISIPAGAVARIELANVSARPTFGVTVNVVNDQPVVASRSVSWTERGQRVVIGSLGAVQPSRRIAVVGTRGRTRTATLVVFNPGPNEAFVDVTAPGAPDDWAGIELAPNTRRALPLDELDSDDVVAPVIVTADEPVVAEARSLAAGERLLMYLMAGVAQERWIGPLTRPPVRRDPALSTRAIRPTPAAVEDLLPQLDEPLPGEEEELPPDPADDETEPPDG